MRKFKKLSKAKQKQLKKKLWGGLKDIVKNSNIWLFIVLIAIEFLNVFLGKNDK